MRTHTSQPLSSWKPSTSRTKSHNAANTHQNSGPFQEDVESVAQGDMAALPKKAWGLMTKNVMRTLAAKETDSNQGRVHQPKLTVGEPGDQYEQEADLVASKVVQRIHPPPLEKVAKRKVMSGDQESLHLKPIQGNLSGKSTVSLEFEQQLQRGKQGGQPLTLGLQQQVGQAMGADFSGVRVHTDATADLLNRSIQSQAFTTGKDIFFRQGTYEPGSRKGQELMAHELTHVIQQRGQADSAASVIQGKWLGPAYTKAIWINTQLTEDEWDEIKGQFDTYENSSKQGEEAISSVKSLRETIIDYKNSEPLTKNEPLKSSFQELVAALDSEIDMIRYQDQKKATTKAFSDGKAPKYLNITPREGSKEGLSKPFTMDRLAPEEQYRLPLPESPDKDIDLSHISSSEDERVIEVLVVSGGHGGIDVIFQSDDNKGDFEKQWWENQMKALAAKKIKARYIILDACLTASSIDAFKPILADGGKIVGFLISIPEAFSNSKFWQDIANASSDDIEDLINTRLEEVTLSHTQTTKSMLQYTDSGGDIQSQEDIEVGSSTAIYSEEKGLRYDPIMLSEELEQGLRTANQDRDLADKNEKALNEFRRMKIAMRKATKVSGFRPTLGQESGEVIVESNLTEKTAEDLKDGTWVNEDKSCKTIQEDEHLPEIGHTLINMSEQSYWEVTATPSKDNGQKFKLKRLEL